MVFRQMNQMPLLSVGYRKDFKAGTVLLLSFGDKYNELSFHKYVDTKEYATLN